jgi:hypothetical protein
MPRVRRPFWAFARFDNKHCWTCLKSEDMRYRGHDSRVVLKWSYCYFFVFSSTRVILDIIEAFYLPNFASKIACFAVNLLLVCIIKGIIYWFKIGFIVWCLFEVYLRLRASSLPCPWPAREVRSTAWRDMFAVRPRYYLSETFSWQALDIRAQVLYAKFEDSLKGI